MISFLQKKFTNLDEHTKEVAVKSFSSTIVKVVGMIAGLFLSILLARTIGAEGLGIINMVNRIMALSLVLGMLGMPNVIIKNISIARRINNFERIGDVMKTSYLINGSFGLLISFVLILLAPILSEKVFNEKELYWPLLIMTIALVPQIFSRIFSAAFIGYRKVWQSNLVNQTLSTSIALFLIFSLILFNIKLDVTKVAIIYVFGRLCVTIVTWFYWKVLFKPALKYKFVIVEMLKTSLPLLLVSGTAIVTSSSSTIILGLLEDASAVGKFGVAATISMLTSFFLQITNSTISPKVASLFFEKKLYEMERMIKRTTVALTFIGVITFLIFVFFGEKILLIWGAEFSQVYLVLIILSFGHFINISTGAAGLVLVMCGFEKIQKNISIVYLNLNILLNLLLILYLGIYGAALATTITIIGENITKVYYTKKKVGVITIPFIKNLTKNNYEE